jgi:hypothetical protein
MRLNGGHQQRPFKNEKETGNASPAWEATSFTLEEYKTIQANLAKHLGPEYVSSRPGPGGEKQNIWFSYLLHSDLREICFNLFKLCLRWQSNLSRRMESNEFS